MIDGANPLQTLLRIIMPQALPAMVAVALFHFFYAWNTFSCRSSIWQASPTCIRSRWRCKPSRCSTAAAGTHNDGQLDGDSAALIALFSGQRFFMQGVVVTGMKSQTVNTRCWMAARKSGAVRSEEYPFCDHFAHFSLSFAPGGPIGVGTINPRSALATYQVSHATLPASGWSRMASRWRCHSKSARLALAGGGIRPPRHAGD